MCLYGERETREIVDVIIESQSYDPCTMQILLCTPVHVLHQFLVHSTMYFHSAELH